MGRSLSIVLGGLLAYAGPAAAQVAANKKADGGFLGGKWYGTTEMRHHLNTYYDAEGAYNRQEPSTHARLQLGAQFYEGMLDVYTTLGVFKIPETQQIMQRRPEVALDYYPLRGEYVALLQYNLVQLPVKQSATIPMSEDERAEAALDPGTVFTLGLAPSVKVPFVAFDSRFDLKAGLDGWTRMYSRRQYLSNAKQPADEDGGDDADPFALSTVDGEPIEDGALHYRSQVMSGVGFAPSGFKPFTAEATAHYQSRFDPRYRRDEAGNVGHHYGVDRYSYYRARLRYEITERIAVTNDFYHFFDGAFEAKREGEDRRFRNIARLSCKL